MAPQRFVFRGEFGRVGNASRRLGSRSGEAACDFPRDGVGDGRDENRVFRSCAPESDSKAAAGSEEFEKPLTHEVIERLLVGCIDAVFGHTSSVDDGMHGQQATRRALDPASALENHVQHAPRREHEREREGITEWPI